MTDLKRIAPLFDGWEETMVWSCLQGVMGQAAANGDYTAGMIANRDFAFLAGKPDRELVRQAAGPILVPRTEDWEPVIEEVFGERAVKEVRYAIKKEPEVFDREKLTGFVSALPEGYRLRLIDEELVPVLLAEEWSKDLCAAFESPADCCERGWGSRRCMRASLWRARGPTACTVAALRSRSIPRPVTGGRGWPRPAGRG